MLQTIYNLITRFIYNLFVNIISFIKRQKKSTLVILIIIVFFSTILFANLVYGLGGFFNPVISDIQDETSDKQKGNSQIITNETTTDSNVSVPDTTTDSNVSVPDTTTDNTVTGSPVNEAQTNTPDTPLQLQSPPTPQNNNYTIPSDSTLVNSASAFVSAVNNSSVGATIALRSGIYYGISLTISKRINIVAYPGESVWFDGQGSLQYALFLVTNSSGGMVRGIGFRNYASTKDFSQKPAMVIVASSVTGGLTIDRCKFQNSSSIGASVQGNNSIVTNNLFDSNNWMGLHVNRADGIIVKGNIMSNNNTGNNALSGTTAAAAGAKFTYTRVATIENNQFINNNSNGLWIDLQASDIRIDGNIASNNARHGIYYEVSTKGTITNNTVLNNSSYGITLSGSNNTTVSGNILSGNSSGNIFVQDDPRNVSNDSLCQIGAVFGADCDSYNNTVQPS